MPAKYSKEEWKRIDEVLDQVLDAEESERADLLNALCGNDQQLLVEVNRLLHAEASHSDTLEKPAISFANTLLKQNNDLKTESKTVTDLSGMHVSVWQLKENIGQGGMGVVYRAERMKGDFQQVVAVKLLHNDSAANQSLIERFHLEQQLLASLDHPNIAQILDGGMTERGQPYFVMEYVQGIPITQYCDAHKLGVDDRLRLSLQVAKALGFAHKKLIVHRDIKPNNILVTDKQEVKLLDFGIAKLLEQAPDMALTKTGESFLTPGFAAPEQLRNQAITVATDVYQLGLVIYELLTGKQAYRLEADSIAELVSIICERAPITPSQIAVSSFPEISNESISRLRNASTQQLQGKLIGDIDALVSKLLSPLPEDRYSSMDAFSQDVHAYFEGLPISARSPTFSYQARKFLRRNWKGASTAALFIVIIIGYAVTVTIQAKEIETALQQSVKEQEKAKRVTDFLVNVFKAADPNVGGLQKITAQELLEKGRVRIQEDLRHLPEIQTHMLTLLGEIYFSQGGVPTSIEFLEESLVIQRSIALDNIPKQVAFANTLTKLAIVYMYSGKYEQAAEIFKESLSLHEA